MSARSFQELEQVRDTELEKRLETVKVLEQSDTETYEVVRDTVTGEHYLHYAYVHLHVAGDGSKELYHHLMPVEHDVVIGLVLGEQDYRYPEAWQYRYLRNGPEGAYVWFDPRFSDELEESERIGREMIEKLKAFKREGRFDLKHTQAFLDEMDRLRKREE